MGFGAAGFDNDSIGIGVVDGISTMLPMSMLPLASTRPVIKRAREFKNAVCAALAVCRKLAWACAMAARCS